MGVTGTYMHVLFVSAHINFMHVDLKIAALQGSVATISNRVILIDTIKGCIICLLNNHSNYFLLKSNHVKYPHKPTLI